MTSRRSSTPFLHRWSRIIIGAIAIIGFLLTSYLTITKLGGGEVACGTDIETAASGCNSVLDSPYATVFGLPLSLYGMGGYVAMATFAFLPLALGNRPKKVKKQWEEWTWLLLLAGGAAMATFSSYLMYILFTKLQTTCYYCITSATFSLTFFLLALLGREWEELGQVFFTTLLVAMITLVGTLGVYSSIEAEIQASTPDPTTGKITITLSKGEAVPPYGWEITTTSGESELALAEHLTAIGAKEYGAFWCPHCFEQKQLFGKEAFSKLNYIECAKEGINPQPEVCKEADLEGFPTWDINGKKYSGTIPLEQLAAYSGYQGPTDFKYTLP